jgi:hypothetical protein
VRFFIVTCQMPITPNPPFSHVLLVTWKSLPFKASADKYSVGVADGLAEGEGEELDTDKTPSLASALSLARRISSSLEGPDGVSAFVATVLNVADSDGGKFTESDLVGFRYDTATRKISTLMTANAIVKPSFAHGPAGALLLPAETVSEVPDWSAKCGLDV